MNKKRVEKLIPKAVEYIDSNLVKEDGTVSKVYQGYLSAFGPTVIASGLLMAVAFNSDKKKKDNNIIMQMMYDLIKDELSTDKMSMLDFLNDKENHKNYAVKNKILDANIACKLAIRTFELKE